MVLLLSKKGVAFFISLVLKGSFIVKFKEYLSTHGMIGRLDFLFL